LAREETAVVDVLALVVDEVLVGAVEEALGVTLDEDGRS
jgi:hypothetical protein